LSAEVDVGQGQDSERTRGTLFKPSIARFAKFPQAFDHAEHMLHERPNAKFFAVLAPGFFADDSIAPTALVGEIFSLGCFAVDQIFLVGIG